LAPPLSSVELNKQANHPFWLSLKCYALLEFDKPDESYAMLNEIKPTRQTDPVVVDILTKTLIKFGMNSEITTMLEHAQKTHPNRIDVNELLMYAYVRENKLLK
jgi:hypothetical protein